MSRVSLGGLPCAPLPPMTLLSWGLDWGVSPIDSSGLLPWQPFTIWGLPRVSLGDVPCTPPPPMTLLSRGLIWGVSPTDSRLLCWQPFTIWEGGACVSLGGVPFFPLPPMTLLSRGLVSQIRKRIFLLGCTYAKGFDWQPCALLSSMGGMLALRHLLPLAAPLFRCFGVLIGGLCSSPLLLLIIIGGLHPPHLILLVIVGGLLSPPLMLSL